MIMNIYLNVTYKLLTLILLFSLKSKSNQSNCQIIKSIGEIYRAIRLDENIVENLKNRGYLDDQDGELKQIGGYLIENYVSEWDGVFGKYISQHCENEDQRLYKTDQRLCNKDSILWHFSSLSSVAMVTTRRLTIDWPKIRTLLQNNHSNNILDDIEAKESEILSILGNDATVEIIPASSSVSRVEGMYRLSQQCITHHLRKDTSDGVNKFYQILNGRDAAAIGVKILFENHLFWAFRWFQSAKHLMERAFHNGENVEEKTEKIKDNTSSIIRSKYLELLFNITMKEFEKTHNGQLYIDHIESNPNTAVKYDEEHCDLKKTVEEDLKDVNEHWNQGNFISVLCRGKSTMDIETSSKLNCYLDSRKSKWFLLMPVKVEEISTEPDILYFHGLVSPQEMKIFKNITLPMMSPSSLGDSHQNEEDTENYRSSYSFFMKSNSHPVTKKIQLRIKELTGFNMNEDADKLESEGLQLNIYGAGGHFDIHYDYFDLNDEKKTKGGSMVHKTGDRLATLMLYMSEGYTGGRTVFPAVGVSLPPVSGSFVYWRNLLPSGTPDQRTIHAACPVIEGEKFVTNKWIRYDPQIFTFPCGLNP